MIAANPPPDFARRELPKDSAKGRTYGSSAAQYPMGHSLGANNAVEDLDLGHATKLTAHILRNV